MNIVTMIVLWVAEKLAEKAFEKLLDKILTDENLKHLVSTLKIQISVLYLDWLLQKTPLRELPEEPEEPNE